MGSNYYYTTPNVTFQNDPFGYRHHEEQAIVTNQKNMSIIMDYRAINKSPLFHQPLFPTDRPILTAHPLVATYIKNFGKGKVIVLGIYGDFLVGNPTFLQFFDKVFIKYALGREMPMPLQSVQLIPSNNSPIMPSTANSTPQ
jgi:hypothetical protein